MIVSLFENVGDTKPKDQSLEAWLLNTIKPDVVTHEKVIQYRETKNKEYKLIIPCITISASFKNYRNLQNIKEYTGLICLDIDRGKLNSKKKSNLCIDMFRVKELFKQHPCTLFAGFSTGDDGVYAIIKIYHKNKLKRYFKHFKKKLSHIGINIDESCKDYTRLRFFSVDKDGYYNPKAKTLRIEKKKIPEFEPKNSFSIKKSDTEKVEVLIQNIEKHNLDITSIYEDWIKIGGALFNTFGEAGRAYFHQISKLHPEYKLGRCNRKFDNCKKMKTNLGSLFYIADNYGIRF